MCACVKTNGSHTRSTRSDCGTFPYTRTHARVKGNFGRTGTDVLASRSSNVAAAERACVMCPPKKKQNRPAVRASPARTHTHTHTHSFVYTTLTHTTTHINRSIQHRRWWCSHTDPYAEQGNPNTHTHTDTHNSSPFPRGHTCISNVYQIAPGPRCTTYSICSIQQMLRDDTFGGASGTLQRWALA